MDIIAGKPHEKIKKFIKRFLIGIIVVLLVIVVGAIALFWNELRTISSITKIDDYGAYQMTYYGDYGFDEFLEVGAQSDADIEKFVVGKLLKGIPIDLGVTGGGCTCFVVKNEQDEILYGRNFDYGYYSPTLQVFTNPKNGYASVSTVNLSFIGYSEGNLPEGSVFNKFLTLAAPYLPCDGINEKGVAIASLSVPEVEPPYDSNKVTLNSTTATRLVLDKAATVEEAVELLRNYNIYFSEDIGCHYLIADASGHSVIVEYYDNELQIVETDSNYQIASNFIAYNGVNIGGGGTEFKRYDTVEKEILDNNGVLNEDNAVSLLAEVGVRDGDIDNLQWSVVYNLTKGEVRFFSHRNTDNVIISKLKMNHN
ncbi:MAG: linear amide C-N hydrolase [bacterium]|nr:linear amide C-N hydrolase [bacterium]MCM1373767.1 linear amide C-N hydrolase [Muribaculum sp.]